MGILDDAIRQHLELKRQHGAPSTDLDRLEQEAFGPATRPGDPEFETGEEPAASAETEAPSNAEAGKGDSDDWLAAADPASGAPEAAAASPPPAEPAGAEPESVEQPIPEAPEGAIFDVEDVDLGEIDLGDGDTPAEQARVEHSHLEDTVDHPAPEGASLSEELEAAAPSLAAEQESAELETLAAPPVEEPEPGDPEVPGSVEEPESIEFDQLPGETVEPGAAPAGDAAVEDDESDEDLLEETPDFLKDAPDGEDLWFEQKGPKDFDFDD